MQDYMKTDGECYAEREGTDAYYAFLDGAPKEENPYHYGSHLYEAWKLGWTRAIVACKDSAK